MTRGLVRLAIRKPLFNWGFLKIFFIIIPLCFSLIGCASFMNGFSNGFNNSLNSSNTRQITPPDNQQNSPFQVYNDCWKRYEDYQEAMIELNNRLRNENKPPQEALDKFEWNQIYGCE